MTLIEALQKLESFSQNLYSIIEGYNYDGYDRLLEKYSLSITNQLKAMVRVIEINDQSTFEYVINNIDSKYRKIYYLSELNEIFQKNDIECVNIQQANQWYIDNMANIDEYSQQIQDLINICQENYENVYQLMNQKFADRFYNR